MKNNNEKIKLINNISSLYKMQYRVGKTNIYIKRDDTLDFAFGGNKVRLFEYIASIIVKSRVERVVTFGSVYSNHVRVAAAVCAKLGVECDIIVLEEEGKKKTGGNFVLTSMYNPNLLYCKLEEAYSFIDDYQERLHKQGIKFLWIPGGGHMPEAAWGYVDAAKEILIQADELNIEFDACFVPCGTGTTQAGIVYGFGKQKTKVFGVTVARTKERCRKEIEDIILKMDINSGTALKLVENINVLDNLNIKYGESNDDIHSLIEDVAITDGIFLDPVYNAKAFLGMKLYLSENTQYKNVLYINTGGTPNIFICEE